MHLIRHRLHKLGNLQRLPLNQRSLSPRFLSVNLTPATSIGNNQFTIPPNSFYSPAIEHVAHFRKFMGESSVIADSFDMEKYCIDWKRNFKGGSLVVLPNSSEQIADIMKYCYAHNVGVVVQGGNTGLVGGAVGTERGELIVSMERMNKILKIDPLTATVVCEAGCILELLNKATMEQGFIIPLDLGPKGSCMIGGNVSTNAGGLRVVKYGSLQANVLGLEVITAQGETIDMLRTLYKDNTGYHLKHLFIGAEGTLGCVTKVALRLYKTPATTSVMLTKVKNFQDVSKVLGKAREVLGSNLSAFEFMDSNCLEALSYTHSHLVSRLKESSKILPNNCLSIDEKNQVAGIAGEVLVLIESSGCDPVTDRDRLDRFVSSLLEEEMVLDAVLSNDQSQELALWSIREHIPVALIDLSRQVWSSDNTNSKMKQAGYMYKFDLSLPLDEMEAVIKETKQALAAKGFQLGIHLPNSKAGSINENAASSSSSVYSKCWLEFCNYGHVGDMNLHLNIHVRVLTNEGKIVGTEMSTEDFFHEVHDIINNYLYHAVLKRKGSISAEHGIGQEKIYALNIARSKEELSLMRQMKHVLDPKHILNPGKMFV